MLSAGRMLVPSVVMNKITVEGIFLFDFSMPAALLRRKPLMRPPAKINIKDAASRQNGGKMRHLMSPLDFSTEELEELFDLANDIEQNPEK